MYAVHLYMPGTKILANPLILTDFYIVKKAIFLYSIPTFLHYTAYRIFVLGWYKFRHFALTFVFDHKNLPSTIFILSHISKNFCLKSFSADFLNHITDSHVFAQEHWKYCCCCFLRQTSKVIKTFSCLSLSKNIPLSDLML